MIRSPIYLNSPEAEAYRSLRTTLSFSLQEPQRAVLFTSARHSEGKSTTACNFAVACAYSERPVLLVDADLRSPALHDVFGLSNGVGLSTCLKAEARIPLQEVVSPTAIPYLDLLTAGPAVSNAAELLTRPSLLDVVSASKDSYEWIILDSPPVLLVTDATILSRAVDGVVLLVNLRRTSLRHARKASELLRAIKAPLLGVVVNHVQAHDAPYGGYGA